MGMTAALMVVSTVSQQYAANKQEKAMESQQQAETERAKLEQKRANLRTARERAQAVRQARIARASATSQNQQMGAGPASSGVIGVQQGVTSQLNSGLAFMSENQGISNQLTSLNLNAARTQAGYQTDINRANAVGNIAQSMLGVFGKTA